MTDPRTCQHCHRRAVSRPRGLCWTCFGTAGVRDLYPVSAAPSNVRGVGNGGSRRPLPAEPTHHPPGTDEKMAVLERRAAAGEQLFHPDDART